MIISNNSNKNFYFTEKMPKMNAKILDNKFLTLPRFNKPEFAIFSDFDETYRPNSEIDRLDCGIKELENYLLYLKNQLDFVFGWISGSNLNSIINKCQNYLELLPHFISSSLGTELYWCEGTEIIEDAIWKNKLLESGFSAIKVESILKKLSSYNITLIKQDSDSQGFFKISYYYKSNDNQNFDFRIMNNLAEEIGIAVCISPCNPAAGDPVGFFDVEFIPNNCGKSKVVEYILQKMNINKRKTIAFGDSCNDLEMLKTVQHGFVLSNADNALKLKYQNNILTEKYCYGIISGIKKIIL